MNRRMVLRTGVAASICGMLPVSFAQQNVVKFVAPFPAGGPIDVITRVLSDSMSRTMNKNFIVENRAGAAGTIGSRFVRSAPPDGNTIMFHQSGFVATPLLSKVPAYDPIKEFSPVCMVGLTPNFLVVHASVPARTVPELIAYAKTLPAGIECGNGGTNTGGHISALMLEKLGKFKILHVPFKGSSEVANALLAGEIKMQVTSQSDAVAAAIKAGKLHVLGVATAKRSPLAPDVPAISEFLPGYALDGWYGVLAPAATPLPVRETLANAIRTAMEEPSTKQKFAALYMEPVWRSPTDFEQVVVNSVGYYRRLISEFNLQLQ